MENHTHSQARLDLLAFFMTEWQFDDCSIVLRNDHKSKSKKVQLCKSLNLMRVKLEATFSQANQ